jgi:hypothetical protein
MPDEMRQLLEAGPESNPVPVGVELSTDPQVVARIEAQRSGVREAARLGELVQVPLLW